MKKKFNFYLTMPVFMAFLCMGFGDVVGPLTGLIKEEFQLSNFLAQMIPFMGFLMFGVLSSPVGIIQDYLGRKNILLIGLLLAFVGLGIPFIARFSSFGSILLGILLLGAGAAFLQVSGNPLMRDVSAEGKYSRNLSLAQFIKAIGSLSGALIPLLAVNYFNSNWKVLFPIYSIIIAITILWLWPVKISEAKPDKAQRATFRSSMKLLGNPFVFSMVTGIFLYVGAEVSMSSGLPIYLKESFGLDIAKLGLLGTLFFFIALMTGRFLGAIVLNWISARAFLRISVLVAIVGLFSLFLDVKAVSLTGIFFVGLGFANIFPLIFSITVDAMPDRSNELSGLMVAAIAGGAIIPLVMGLLADYTSSLVGFVIPMICILYIAILAYATNKVKIPS